MTTESGSENWKTPIIAKYGSNPADTGRAEVQIALLSDRIARLTEHFRSNKQDKHSLRGMTKMIARRRKLLDFLKKTEVERYRAIVAALELRR